MATIGGGKFAPHNRNALDTTISSVRRIRPRHWSGCCRSCEVQALKYSTVGQQPLWRAAIHPRGIALLWMIPTDRLATSFCESHGGLRHTDVMHRSLAAVQGGGFHSGPRLPHAQKAFCLRVASPRMLFDALSMGSVPAGSCSWLV